MTNDLDAIEQEYNKWNGCQECGLDIYIPPLILELREARAGWAADYAELDDRIGELQAERDDWRRRYEALRDGVLSKCDQYRAWGYDEIPTVYLREVVARVEENNA